MGMDVILLFAITSKERSDAAREIRPAIRIRAVMSSNIGPGLGNENCGMGAECGRPV